MGMNAKREPGPNAREAATWLPPADLRPNPRNPRLHREDVQRLARSIVRLGWGAPILAQRETLRVIGGHGRLEAALAILRGIVVDDAPRGGSDWTFARDAPGPGVVPVRLLDVSDAEADALTLLDNAKGLQGEDDPAALVAMAAQFGRDSEMLRDAGLGPDELDALVQQAGNDALRDEDGSSRLGGLSFAVIVQCDDEQQQTELITRFEREGLSCRPLMS